jgi:monovalent cation/hydrogen antiporter
MQFFELTLLLLVSAVGLAALARRIKVPYPALLALGGTALALFPAAPTAQLNPELTLALFVAPVLLDAAYDTSVRDLRANWIPVTCLVLIAVGLTTCTVAWLAHTFVPGMPWAAAVALGAVVAPPDAAAAAAVLRHLRLPHRMLVVLEGESLLNDASALLIYRLAVLAAAPGGLEMRQVIPITALSILGSLIAGYVLARAYMRLQSRITDPSSSTVMQFAGTFGVWILAEEIGLSPIVTIVVYGITLARFAPREVPALQRVPSYAVWDTAVFVLNVLAFVLIGLQLRPILSGLEPSERVDYLQFAVAVLAVVIGTRFVWMYIYYGASRLKVRVFGAGRWPGPKAPTPASVAVVAWCGMRGIVTLAAAYALPSQFPHRDLILWCAFCVVVGTLVLQGFTLRPLLLWLALRDDGPVDREVHLGRERLARAGLAALDTDTSTEAQVLRRELQEELDGMTNGELADGRTRHDQLRSRVIDAQRATLLDMRAKGEIGDTAFHRLEARLDLAELTARGLPES